MNINALSDRLQPLHAPYPGLLRAAICAALLLGVSACNKETPNAAADKGQVIAKVGNSDITIHELQNEYRRLNVPADKINDAVAKAVLNDIVRRKYLTQRAVTAGLDREPTNLLDILRAREQTLATAMLQRDIQSKVSGIGKAEVERYINANPNRFSKRVRLNIDQLTVNGEALTPAFLESIAKATTLEEVERKVAENGMFYSRGIGALFSGEIPDDLLAKARSRGAADIFFVRSGSNGVFFRVKNEEPDPLSGDAATQRAQGLLRSDVAQAEVTKKMTGDIEISYFGEYTKLMAEPAPTAPATDGQPKTEGTAPVVAPPKSN